MPTLAFYLYSFIFPCMGEAGRSLVYGGFCLAADAVTRPLAPALALGACTVAGHSVQSQVDGPVHPRWRKAEGSAAFSSHLAPSAKIPGGEREDLMNPIVLKDALTHIDELEKTFDWKPFRPGVEIARIYTSPDEGPSAAFLRYQAGASVPFHKHAGYEHIFILRGTQVDRSGEHGAGSVIINPPGSAHTVGSPDGCIVLIVWDKPVILL